MGKEGGGGAWHGKQGCISAGGQCQLDPTESWSMNCAELVPSEERRLGFGWGVP